MEIWGTLVEFVKEYLGNHSPSDFIANISPELIPTSPEIGPVAGCRYPVAGPRFSLPVDCRTKKVLNPFPSIPGFQIAPAVRH